MWGVNFIVTSPTALQVVAFLVFEGWDVWEEEVKWIVGMQAFTLFSLFLRVCMTWLTASNSISLNFLQWWTIIWNCELPKQNLLEGLIACTIGSWEAEMSREKYYWSEEMWLCANALSQSPSLWRPSVCLLDGISSHSYCVPTSQQHCFVVLFFILCLTSLLEKSHVESCFLLSLLKIRNIQ